MTRRMFLKLAMVAAVTLHLAPGLARAEPPPPAITSFPPEDCYAEFPICFRLHFTQAKHRLYLPVVEK